MFDDYGVTWVTAPMRHKQTSATFPGSETWGKLLPASTLTAHWCDKVLSILVQETATSGAQFSFWKPALCTERMLTFLSSAGAQFIFFLKNVLPDYKSNRSFWWKFWKTKVTTKKKMKMPAITHYNEYIGLLPPSLFPCIYTCFVGGGSSFNKNTNHPNVTVNYFSLYWQ